MAGIDTATRSKILVCARRWIDKKYDDSHADTAWRDLLAEPEVFDCSAFVCRVAMEALGYASEVLPRSASWMLDNLPEVTSASPGDVVGYGRSAVSSDGAFGHQTVWHVMIYLGNGQVIGACDVARKVTIRPLTYEPELGRRRWQLATPPYRSLRIVAP